MARRTKEAKEEAIRENLTDAALIDLYGAVRSLDSATRDRIGLTIPCDIYVQDPLFEADERIQKTRLQWEPGISDGPTSARIAVVDYNADIPRLTLPAVWNDDNRVFLNDKKKPLAVGDVSDAHFRQVNAWAIVQRVLEFYQSPQVMGRPIPWGFNGNRLIVVPAAGWGENAFYDRDSKSLQFYYFGEEKKERFTCLSHDIVSHETGHAILDGIRPYYYEHSSVQTTAFHEFVGDLTAIFTALRHNDLRRLIATLTGSNDVAGMLAGIGNLAEEFGKFTSDRPYLRSAGTRRTMPEIAGMTEPHDVSEVLTSAVFQIFVRIVESYLKAVDENGTAEDSGDRDDNGDADGPAKPKVTVGQALWRAFQRVSASAFQALDLCPAVDIQFIDYARAFLRCDELSEPVDAKGLRVIMSDVFHDWGFCDQACDRGNDCALATDASRLAALRGRAIARSIERISRSRTEAYQYLHDNRKALGIPSGQDVIVADLYESNKLDPAANRLPTQIVLVYVWEEAVPLDGSRFGALSGKVAQLLCGGTIVFDDRGNLQHWVHKPGTESAEGIERADAVRGHIAERVSKRMIADPDDALGVRLAGSRPVVASLTGETVRLAAAHHLSDGRHNEEDDSWTASF
jgi:hypothetical protein